MTMLDHAGLLSRWDGHARAPAQPRQCQARRLVWPLARSAKLSANSHPFPATPGFVSQLKAQVNATSGAIGRCPATA